MLGFHPDKKRAAPAQKTAPRLGLRPRSNAAVVAQAQNQAPDSIPGMFKPGEFVLPPDTVHAMGGADALKAVVDATHTPVNTEPVIPRGFKPQVFFDQGGLPEDQIPRGQRVAPYVNHRAPNGAPAMPEPPLLGNSVPPQTGLQATSRPNFTMGGGPEIPARPSGPDVTDVRPKFNPANASKEAQAWLAERAAGGGQPAPQAPAGPASPAAAPSGAVTPQAAAPQGAAYRAGAAVGRAAGTVGRAVGAVAVPATLAGTASAVAETPTEDYEKRFGFQPNTQEGFAGFARDVGVRALGAASDLGDGLTFGLAGKHLFADKQGRGDPVVAVPPVSAGPAPAANTAPVAATAATAAADAARPASHEYGPPGAAAPTQVLPGVYRRGNSYADSAQDAALGDQPRGLPSKGAMAAADNLAAQQQSESLARVQAGMAPPPTSALQRVSIVGSGDSFGFRRAAHLRGGDRADAARLREAQRYEQKLGHQAAQQQIERDRIAVGAAQAARGLNFDQQRLAHDRARLDNDRRVTDSDLQARGLKMRAASQEEALRNVIVDPKATAEQKLQARQALRSLSGEADPSPWAIHVTPAVKNADGSTTEGSVYRSNKATGEVQRVDVGGNGLPPGMVKVIGSSGGKPVYEDAKGKKHIGD